MQNLAKPQWTGELTFFQKNQKLNSRIVYDDQTLKNTNFLFKKQRISCFYQWFSMVFSQFSLFFTLFKNLTKKVGFQAILLGRKISRIALFCQFWRIFMNFKETSLLRDDPKSSEMDEIVVSACIQDTKLYTGHSFSWWLLIVSQQWIFCRYRWNNVFRLYTEH